MDDSTELLGEQLVRACADGDTAMVDALLRNQMFREELACSGGGFLDKARRFLEQGTGYAAAWGHTDVVHRLLDYGATIYTRWPVIERIQNETHTGTPLYLACAFRRIETVRYMLERCGKVKDSECLYHAVTMGYTEIVRLLLAHGANVEYQHFYGSTPLIVACESGTTDMVQLLLAHGADIDHQKMDGSTPLRVACDSGRIDMVQLLLAHGANLEYSKNYDESTPLHVACRSGTTDMAQLLLDHGANLERKEYYGSTPLHVACESGGTDVVQLLLERGANINHQSRYGETALIRAIKRRSPKKAQLLLEYGADTEKQDDEGRTALLHASGMGETEIVSLLLDRGANIDHLTQRKETALLLQCKPGGSVVMIRLLLDRGANIDHQNIKGETALILASKSGCLDMIRLLLDRGVNIDLQNIEGETALLLACKSAFQEASFLHSIDIDYHHDRVATCTLFRYGGYNEVVQLLLEWGADTEIQNNVGETALFYCVGTGKWMYWDRCLRAQRWSLLPLKNGANIEHQSQECTGRRTSLLHAIATNALEMAVLLLRNGAYIHHRDKNGRTALESESPHQECPEYVYHLIKTAVSVDGGVVSHLKTMQYSPPKKDPTQNSPPEPPKKKARLVKEHNNERKDEADLCSDGRVAVEETKEEE